MAIFYSVSFRTHYDECKISLLGTVLVLSIWVKNLVGQMDPVPRYKQGCRFGSAWICIKLRCLIRIRIYVCVTIYFTPHLEKILLLKLHNCSFNLFFLFFLLMKRIFTFTWL
jgi:hypothetical protein